MFQILIWCSTNPQNQKHISIALLLKFAFWIAIMSAGLSRCSSEKESAVVFSQGSSNIS